MIILASQSKQRLFLMKSLGIPFEVIPAEVDEKAIQNQDFAKRAVKIARAKAEKIQEQYPEAIIIAADTFTVVNKLMLEKPKDKSEAKKMLKMLSGQTGIAHTGLCYLDQAKEIDYHDVIKTVGVFRVLSDQEIEHYIATQPVTTWAGGYSPAYHAGAALIATIDGSLTNFTHGLPMEVLVPLLRKSGVKI